MERRAASFGMLPFLFRRTISRVLVGDRKDLEARVGIEPTHKGFADLSLTTWVPRLHIWKRTLPLLHCKCYVLSASTASDFSADKYPLRSLAGYKRWNIHPTPRRMALQHGVENPELPQSIDELRIFRRSARSAD